MKIYCIGDTHIPDRYEQLPRALLKELKKADLIVHTGDFVSIDFFKELQTLKPLKAVLGNMDAGELHKILKKQEVFKAVGFKIGLTHGYGPPESVLENTKRAFDDSFDVVIFGHTHKASCKKLGKTIFLNPGSPTDKIFALSNTYAILEINEAIDARIVKL